MRPKGALASSFRDPSGVVFRCEEVLLRGVASGYLPQYEAVRDAGLFEELVRDGLLVPFEEVASSDFPLTLKPAEIPFISYPYEWCFGQWKDAALATLAIQERALAKGFSLKDASGYNIQFFEGRPVLIDTLSFEEYVEGKPWVAYRQFCQHFLAPILLQSMVDVRLAHLSRIYIDGVPLDLASELLPGKSKFNPWIQAHIHMHAKAQSSVSSSGSSAKVSKVGLLGVLDNLKSLIEKQDWKPGGTIWANYYSETNYSEAAMAAKREIVSRFLTRIEPKAKTVWDIGANTGEFSRIAAEMGAFTVAFDMDVSAVETLYRSKPGPRVIPLLQDLSNPSPSQGWAHHERDSLEARGPAEVVMALALVHHLAIGNNVPLAEIAAFFARCGRWAIVEFVPKEDSQVQRMLSSREDVFGDYSEDGFLRAVTRTFDVVAREAIPESARAVFLLKRTNLDTLRSD